MIHPLTDLAQQIFDEINAITEDGPGITRPSYSQLETQAHGVVAKYANDWGFRVEIDSAANLHVISDGDRDQNEVVTGSHLDTVPNGGRYDGTAGVVAGLIAMHQRQFSSASNAPLRLIVFRGEESAWFGQCYLGSRALFGKLRAATLSAENNKGQVLGERIDACGGNASTIARGEGLIDCNKIDSFVEVHIEQGPVLHDIGVPIAIVDSIRGNYRYRGARINGEAGHSGTTPTRLRKDAVLAFADLANRLEQGARAFGEDLVMTIGVAGTDPARHAVTIIPESVTFDLEFRSGNSSTLELFDTFYRATTEAVLAQRKLPGGLLGVRTVTEPAVMDPMIRKKLLVDTSIVLGTDDMMHLQSGAGHDAACFALARIPTGMIFIRNEHGSHNPQESMRMDDFMLAVDVLYRAMGGS